MTATAQKAPPPIGLNALDKITPAIVFAPGGVDKLLDKIEAEVKSIKIDITTKAGQEACASAAYKVARSKTFLDDMGKEFVAELKKQTGAVDAERRKIRERLDELKDEVRAPLTKFETDEKARVDGHEAALATIAAMLALTGERTPAEIDALLQELGEIAQRDWQEYEARAVSTIDHIRAGLRKELAAAQKREADRAELEELRQKQAERDAKDRDERIASEAAEQARAHAERAAQAERDRIEQEKRDAEQRAHDAEAAVAQAEADRIAAAEQAKRDAAAAAEQAERDRQAAIIAERERIEAVQRAVQAAAAKREANKKHAAKINNEALAALVERGVPAELGKVIIGAIVRGEIPHTKISY